MAGCCQACKPRYKRLVDNIFPADPEEGLVKSSMDKLIFFAMKSPEKLDRIGDYLAQKLSRDVYRQRTWHVRIALEALDILLVTCHAQSLNLYVESFLKMVQKLLECNEGELQVLATESFVKFAKIEEDTPSYHRRYDFFVSKFSAMSHSGHENMETRAQIRVAGLKGLQGVVRKTVSDDLQVNIWEPTHMDKIVPSLLFNMQENCEADPDSPKDEEHPSQVAETAFRDLVCRASYGNINSVIKPVLAHLDNHNLWVPNDFGVKCFKIIMYSAQAQYGYVVVQMLMNHLDENSNKDAKIKESIVGVLYETVLIAAGGSIGPSVLDVFNTLLRHLRMSVDADTKNSQRGSDEKNFQETIINTIGEFANNLPDYQKIEILMFVMGKVPLPSDDDDGNKAKEVLLQTRLMKTILKVATKYKTVLIANAFPSAFLDPLLRMSLVHDPGIRHIVQEILHTLIDRHDNQHKLKSVRIPKDIEQLDLTVEKPPRQDVMFMKKNGSLFYRHIFENMQQVDNNVCNFESLYCTMCLISIEMGGDEILMDLFGLALGIQEKVSKSSMSITHKCAIHALIAAYLNLISQLTAIPALCQHVAQVIEKRRAYASYYLPDVAFNRSNTSQSYLTAEDVNEEWLFNLDAISEALESSGHHTSCLVVFDPKPSLGLSDLDDEVFVGDGFDMNTLDLNKSVSDLESISLNIPSAGSTPVSIRRFGSNEEVTFESLKQVLENNPKSREEEEKKRLAILESFTSGPFEDIVARSEAKSQQFDNTLNEILDLISVPQQQNTAEMSEDQSIYDIQFPELFVY